MRSSSESSGDRRPAPRVAAVAELRKRFEALTAREREVMGLVVTGRLNKQIAADSMLAR